VGVALEAAVASTGTAENGNESLAAAIPYGVSGPKEEELVELPDDVVDDLLKRLRRIEGQVRGIQAMLTDGRDCRDVVTQISAASKALEQAGFKLVASGLTYCVNDPERAAKEGYALEDLQKMFMKLA
jgi:DNA-binding FrmR family transcriptional regulator